MGGGEELTWQSGISIESFNPQLSVEFVRTGHTLLSNLIIGVVKIIHKYRYRKIIQT